jgi:hypothetical protein
VKDIIRAGGFEPERLNKVDTPIEAPLHKYSNIIYTEQEEKDMADKEEIYGTVVGMLSYLSGTTRPDLAYSVGQLQRFVSFPRHAHWLAMVRVLRYLAGTQDYGLLYKLNSPGGDVFQGYSDSDWATDKDDRCSTTGTVWTFCGAAFAWRSRKQPGTAARSSAAAELVALDQGARDALWLNKFVEELDLHFDEPLNIRVDNEAAYYTALGSRWSQEQKHLDTKYFAVRQDYLDGRLTLSRVPTNENLADAFTKPLKKTLFARSRSAMGVVSLASLSL